MKIDLNVDLGEGFPFDKAFTALASSVNIACGGHAGNDDAMRNALLLARHHGTSVGAHPSFLDRRNFGRRHFASPPPHLSETLVAQIQSLKDLADSLGIPLKHVKPHGALYNQAHRDADFARAIIHAMQSFPKVLLYGLPDGALAQAAQSAGIPFIPEGFLDRRYRHDGSLVPRSEAGALIEDFHQAAAQASQLIHSGKVRTLCVHGESEESLALLEFVRKSLEREAIITPP